MAAGCRHPLTNLSLLLVLFLFYSVYPVPFITLDQFLASEDFFLIHTCGGVAILMTTIFGNILVLLVFTKLQNTEKYLYFIMITSDMVHPLFYIPIRLAIQREISLITKHKNYTGDYMVKLVGIAQILLSVRHALVVSSMISFTIVCVLKLYFTAAKCRVEKIPQSVKIFTCAITVFSTFFLAWLYNLNTNNEFGKVKILVVLSYFIPITISTICLLATLIIRRRMSSIENSIGIIETAEVPNNKFIFGMWLSYVVFWMPWFIVATLTHMQHNAQTRHSIEILLLLKGCASCFLMIELDPELKIHAILLLKSCCHTQGQLQTSLRLSVSTSKDKLFKKISILSRNEEEQNDGTITTDHHIHLDGHDEVNDLMNGDNLAQNYYCTNV